MIKELNLKPGDYAVIEDRAGSIGNWDIRDQVEDLTNMLASSYLEDIKLIGFSEGAAAVITVLDKLANDDSFLDYTNVRDVLSAAITIESITLQGSSLRVKGWDENRYNNLPQRLSKVARNAQLLDVWNEASFVHSHAAQGWEKNSLSYDSRPWWQRTLYSIGSFFTGGSDIYSRIDTLAGTGLKYHNDPLTNIDFINDIKKEMNL